MRKALIHLVLVCVVGITIALVDRTHAEAYEVYYLSVGNDQYRDNNLWIPDANLNASQIARYLRRAGAVDGITLVSEQGAYVTRNDVMGALKEIASKAKVAKDPLVVYYFIGHGASRGAGWSHVSLVGDYKPSDPADVARSRAIVETREVKQLLEKQDLPYLLILDNCYYRAPEGAFQLLSRTINEKAFDIGDAIGRIPTDLGTAKKSMIGIVLYAAKPGRFVQTLPHPWYESRSIGPLGRRLLLLLKVAIESEKGLSVGRFLEQMNDPALDPTSVIGYHTVWSSDSGLMDETILAGARAKAAESVRVEATRRGSGGGDGR